METKVQKEVIYDVDYFINKFENITPEDWCIKNYVNNGKYCALGHCGERKNIESKEAEKLDRLLYYTPEINDGRMIYINNATELFRCGVIADTPQSRILMALYNLKYSGQETY